MLTVAEMELALAAAEGYLRGKVLAGDLTPDHDLAIGSRCCLYFPKDRKQEIANRCGLTPVTAANIRERFLAFCEEMDMSASYKPVLLRCLLDTVVDDGSVPINRLTLAFRDFYLERKAAGLPVEKTRARMARVDELTETDIRQLILTMPFKKFAQRGLLSYDRDASRLRFAPVLWQRIRDEDARQKIRDLANTALNAYLQRVGLSESASP